MRLITKDQMVQLFKDAGLTEQQMDTWHTLFETRYPEAHDAFLTWIGLNDSEIQRVRKHYQH